MTVGRALQKVSVDPVSKTTFKSENRQNVRETINHLYVDPSLVTETCATCADSR